MGTSSQGELNDTRLAIEGEKTRQIGVKSILIVNNPAEMVSSLFTVYHQSPYILFKRSGKKGADKPSN